MSEEEQYIDDDAPIDFDSVLNDFSIGEDTAPDIPPPPPSNTPRARRRVLINEDDNTTHEVPAAGKQKKLQPSAIRKLNAATKTTDDIDSMLKSRLGSGAAPLVEPPTGEDIAEKQVIITQITELKKKLFVEGSGMRPTTFNTMEQLVAERDLCNTQINSRRGNTAMTAGLVWAAGLVEKVLTAVAPPEQLDVSSHYHLQDEVKECKAMFEESLLQISILHAGWFAVSPYADVAQCMGACISSVNAKNQKIREFEKSPTASAPNTPVSATGSNSQDDDNETVDVLQ